MQATQLTKLYLFSIALLSLGTSYLYWQHTSLSQSWQQDRELCEQEIAGLLAKQQGKQEDETQARTSTRRKPDNPDEIGPVELVQAAKTDEKPRLQNYNETMDDLMRRKYRFLLSRLQLSEAKIEELIRLLKQREHVYLKLKDAEEFGEELDISMSEIADLRYQLEQLDREIQAIITDEETSRRFALLKDSDMEQQEFSQYALGLNGLFPLSRKQQEKVLLTRLEHKQSFDKTLTEIGLDMDYPLTWAQQQEMLSRIDYALFRYKKAWLEGVKPHLEHDESAMNQYALLENYTNTEFKQIQERLRKKVQQRGLVDPPPSLSQN